MYGLGGVACLLRHMQGTQPLWATVGLTLPGPCCMPLIPAASFLVPPCPVCYMMLQPSNGAMLPRQDIATALKCAPEASLALKLGLQCTCKRLASELSSLPCHYVIISNPIILDLKYDARGTCCFFPSSIWPPEALTVALQLM